MWNRKRDRISRNVLVKSDKDGGLNVPHVKSYTAALKLTWIRKLRITDHKWKDITIPLYPDVDNINMYGPSVCSGKPHCNSFWKDLFCVYEQFRYNIYLEAS